MFNNKYFPFLLSLFLLILGLYLYGTPRLYLQELKYSNQLGAFILFLFWVQGTFSFGCLILKVLKVSNDGPIIIASGIVAQCFILFIFAHLGFLNQQNSHYSIAIFLFLSLFSDFRRFRFRLKKITLDQSYLILFLLTLATLSFIPNMHYDSLWYHISGPWQWFLNGQPSFNPDFININVCYFWEYLYYIPFMFLSGGEGTGVVAIHIFTQWIVFFTAVIPSVMVFKMLYHRMTGNNHPNLFYLSMIAAICSFGLFHTTYTSKNDWGVIFFCLSGLYLIENEEGKNSTTLGFILLSASFASKISYLFFVAPYILTVLYRHKQSKEVFARLIGFFPIPIMVFSRNYIWTGNPIFPAIGHLFNYDNFSHSWINASTFYNSLTLNLNISHILSKYSEIFPLNRIYNIIFLLPLLSVFFKRLDHLKKYFSFTALICISSFLFVLKIGPLAEIRLLGIINLFVYFTSVYLILDFAKSKLPNKFFKPIEFIFLIYILSIPNFDILKIKLMLNDGSPSVYTYKFPGGYCNLWLHEKLGNNKKIKVFSINDTRNYYFLDLPYIRLGDSITLDKITYESISLKRKLKLLEKKGAAFLYEVVDPIDVFYNKSFWLDVFKLANEHPESIAFQTKTCRIIDIKNAIKIL